MIFTITEIKRLKNVQVFLLGNLAPADFAEYQQEVETHWFHGYQNVQNRIGKCVLDKRKCTAMVNNLASGDIEIGLFHRHLKGELYLQKSLNLSLKVEIGVQLKGKVEIGKIEG